MKLSDFIMAILLSFALTAIFLTGALVERHTQLPSPNQYACEDGYEQRIGRGASMQPFAPEFRHYYFLQPVDAYMDFSVGDVVSFHTPGRYNHRTRHMVIEVLPDGLITQGTGNNVRDPYVVPWDHIIGRDCWRVPQ